MFTRIINTFKKNTKKKRNSNSKRANHNFLNYEKTPIFHKKKKRIFLKYTNFGILQSIYKNKIYIYTLLGISIGGLILCALFSPFFNIKSIYIYRQDPIINIDQAYSNIEYIRGSNLLFVDTNDIAKRLQRSQKSISHIEIQTKFPNSIEISLGGYAPVFQGETHLVLSNGSVISKDSKQYSDVPVISTSKDLEEYALFGEALNTRDIQNISLLISETKKNILGFQISALQYFITEKELMIQNDIGSIFIFDLENDINTQIKKLAIFRKDRVNINEKKYIYIDVRVPERLFLCPYEAEFDCRNNINSIYGENTFNNFMRETSEPQL